jgi:hypothetical protein
MKIPGFAIPEPPLGLDIALVRGGPLHAGPDAALVPPNSLEDFN